MAKRKKASKVQKRGKLQSAAKRGKARTAAKAAKAPKRTVARAKPKPAPVKKVARKVKPPVAPVVETVAVEVVAQPAPGVITVTEVEETEVRKASWTQKGMVRPRPGALKRMNPNRQSSRGSTPGDWGWGAGGLTRRVTVNDSGEGLFRPGKYFEDYAERHRTRHLFIRQQTSANLKNWLGDVETNCRNRLHG
jgi:hypothetical protein